MEESGPAITTISQVLRGGMSLPILLGFCHRRVKAQLDCVWVCGYNAHGHEFRFMGLFNCMGLGFKHVK